LKRDVGSSDEKHNDATEQKNPAAGGEGGEGGAYRLLGSVAALARWPRIALRAAPPRMSRSAPVKLISINPEPL